jgi:hypothetical protein
MNELSRPVKVIIDRFTAATGPLGILSGCTFQQVMTLPEAIEPNMLPYIGMAVERSGKVPDIEFVGQQATATLELGFRLHEDSQYGYCNDDFTRGLLPMLERVLDVIYGLGVQTALTGDNSWLRAPQFEIKGLIPDVGNGQIGYGFTLKLFTDMFDLGKLSAQ